MEVGVLVKKGHLSVALQITSPLINRLSTANMVSVQVPGYLGFPQGFVYS